MAKSFKTRGKSLRIFFVLTKVRKKGYNMREVNMVLYHGSSVEVSQPEILSAERALDFGAGFYTTTDREQAERWARRVTVRNCAAQAVLNIYELDESALKKLSVKRFRSAGRQWLEFVCRHRREIGLKEMYDVIIGPVADDRVYRVMVQFENGELDTQEALKRLKTEKLTDQVVFCSERALRCLRFIGAEEI